MDDTHDAEGPDTEAADAQPGDEAVDLDEAGRERLRELRTRLEDIEEIPLEERVELFEELDRLLGEQLDALEDRVG